MDKVKTVIIEEFVNVDKTFQNIKNIKVGSMTLNDLFGDNLKVIEKALEERKELLKWKDSQQDLIKGKDEYIAKLCNDRTELKEQLKKVEDFKYHYDRYKKELANNLKVINCMQEEATTNYNLINQLEDRNDRLVERLEKQKGQITCLRIENANLLGESFLPNNDKPKIVEFLKLDENDIIDLINFAKIFTKNSIVHSNDMWIGKIYFDRQVCGDEKFDLIKKVVEKYGNKMEH